MDFFFVTKLDGLIYRCRILVSGQNHKLGNCWINNKKKATDWNPWKIKHQIEMTIEATDLHNVLQQFNVIIVHVSLFCE